MSLMRRRILSLAVTAGLVGAASAALSNDCYEISIIDTFGLSAPDINARAHVEHQRQKSFFGHYQTKYLSRLKQKPPFVRRHGRDNRG